MLESILSLLRTGGRWRNVPTERSSGRTCCVQAQLYSRDPGSGANINLSNALEFTLEP